MLEASHGRQGLQARSIGGPMGLGGNLRATRADMTPLPSSTSHLRNSHLPSSTSYRQAGSLLRDSLELGPLSRQTPQIWRRHPFPDARLAHLAASHHAPRSIPQRKTRPDTAVLLLTCVYMASGQSVNNQRRRHALRTTNGRRPRNGDCVEGERTFLPRQKTRPTTG